MAASDRPARSPLASIAGIGLVACAILAAVVVALFVSWQRDAARLERLHRAASAIAGFGDALLGAESAMRGYLLTGHVDDRAAYNTAVESAEGARAAMQEALEPEAPSRGMLDDALRIGEAATVDWRRMIMLRDTQGAAAFVVEGAPTESRMRFVASALEPLGERVAGAVTQETAAAAHARRNFLVAAVLLAAALAVTVPALALLAFGERRLRLDFETAFERESQHDHRTRLPNRRFFTEWVGYVLAGCRRDGDGLGLLMIGVESGDMRLRTQVLAPEIARRLRALKRESDFLGLVDENVFALAALRVKDPGHLAGLGQRILHALSEPALPGSKIARIAPCVGIAMFPDDADDLPGLFAAADSALTSARHGGGNRVMFHGGTAPGVPASIR